LERWHNSRPLNNPRFSPLHKKPLADLVRR
jgi:hypothetical protein